MKRQTHNPGEPKGKQKETSEDEIAPTSRSTSGTWLSYYPSWLPKRPAPPPPHSSAEGADVDSPTTVIGPEPEVEDDDAQHYGRRATPRSVRILTMPSPKSPSREKERQPTDETTVNMPQPRATPGPLTPIPFFGSQPHRPRFNAPGLHLEFLESPSLRSRLRFYLLPLTTFAHIPLQTFFDFNAIFVLFQVSKFPNPDAPGVPGSGKNWAFGAAAYIACWSIWIICVFIVYELIYSFYRRWRTKRPLILPLYTSSPAYNLVSMTSFTNFCFFKYIRRTAFSKETGSLRDGLAETFYFYSQNVPTVVLLLPRAGLSLALLLTFSSANPGLVLLNDQGVSPRDGTFFNASDGALSGYARGVLFANAAWTAWRALVVLISLIGLWIVSGKGFAGICGPRYRWEETDEKRASYYSDAGLDSDALPWAWRERTKDRIQAAYDLCMTSKRRGARSSIPPPAFGDPEKQEQEPPFAGMEQIFSAPGFPSTPAAARRGGVAVDIFDSPVLRSTELSDIIPPVTPPPVRPTAGPSKGPLMQLPYPFTIPSSAVASSAGSDVANVPIPFPSPQLPPGDDESGDIDDDFEGDIDIDFEDDEEEEEGELQDDEVEVEEGYLDEGAEEVERRESGSLSSLGKPVPSRYPFAYRGSAPRQGPSSRGGSVASRGTRASHSTSSRSRMSAASKSTGNGETSDSRGSAASVPSLSIMPPPPVAEGSRRRRRAGTVPSIPSSPIPEIPRSRTHTIGGTSSASRSGPGSTGTFGSLQPEPQLVYESANEEEGSMEGSLEGSQEAAERDDNVGLLTSSPHSSRRPSLAALRHHASNISQRLSTHTRSRSNSRHSGSRSVSISTSGSSGVNMRSRAQSLVQTVTTGVGAAAARSSSEMSAGRRSRASSAGLSPVESHYSSPLSQGQGRSSEETNPNYTFGRPLPWIRTGGSQEESSTVPQRPEQERQRYLSQVSTASRPPPSEPITIPTPASGQPPWEARLPTPTESEATELQRTPSETSVPAAALQRTQGTAPQGISPAPLSFVTQPASISAMTTDTSSRSAGTSTWAGLGRYYPDQSSTQPR